MPGNSGKNSYQRGRWAEQAALEYLLTRNLKLLYKNFRSAFGEIDLIMQDKNIVLFIEVRYRSNNHFHTSLESINNKKCDRIIATSTSLKIVVHHNWTADLTLLPYLARKKHRR